MPGATAWPLRQPLQLDFRKVVPDHADGQDGMKHRRRISEERRRSTQGVGVGAERRLDRVEGDAANDQQSHDYLSSLLLVFEGFFSALSFFAGDDSVASFGLSGAFSPARL